MIEHKKTYGHTYEHAMNASIMCDDVYYDAISTSGRCLVGLSVVRVTLETQNKVKQSPVVMAD